MMLKKLPPLPLVKKLSARRRHAVEEVATAAVGEEVVDSTAVLLKKLPPPPLVKKLSALLPCWVLLKKLPPPPLVKKFSSPSPCCW